MMADCYIAIIGGGIIGNAISYEISKLFNNEIICLLEKNKHFPGENQTSRNSGVLHAGIYYDEVQSPLKARLCVEGNELLYQFCQIYHLPLKRTGKLVVATNAQEDQSLEELLLRSKENKVPNVKKLNKEETQSLEPNVVAYSSLFVPTSGILDPLAVVCKLKELSNLKEYFLLGTTVIDISPREKEFILKTRTNENEISEFSTKYIINAAGLESDKIARMVNDKFPLEIFPVRGESAKFYQSREDLKISRNIYPVPKFYNKPDGSKHLTVGVHLTPTFSLEVNQRDENEPFKLGKEITIGPLNRKRGKDLEKNELGSDLAIPSVFLEEIKKYFPSITLNEIQLHQTGIQAVLANSLDFHIAPDEIYPNLINVVGICSPGLTSSLAIAKKVKSFIQHPH